MLAITTRIYRDQFGLLPQFMSALIIGVILLVIGSQHANAQTITSFKLNGNPIPYANIGQIKPISIPQLNINYSVESDTQLDFTSAGFEPAVVMTPIVNPSSAIQIEPIKSDMGSQPKSSSGLASPQAYGSFNMPYSIARAASSKDKVTSQFPFSAAGKLFITLDGISGSWWCSGSLIKSNLVLTASHCLPFINGKSLVKSIDFAPGYNNGNAPFGVFHAVGSFIMNNYYNCSTTNPYTSPACPDDVAVIALNSDANGKSAASYAGGYFGYSYNNKLFTPSGKIQITQLGYPGGLDNGTFMERNDARGFVNKNLARNTVIGTAMDGGSSGGPLIANFGVAPALTREAPIGSESASNIIVGVLSWDYDGGTTGVQNPGYAGSSPLTSSNIKALVNSACGQYPNACN